MSKAFTDEEASDSTVAGREVIRAAPGQERPITREGHRRLEEVVRAAQEERQQVLALADPSLRDARLRDVDHRLALAEATLASVRVVDRPLDPQTVAFGCRVTIRRESGRLELFTLVGPDEADAREGRLSVLSPLGRALVGLTPGDEAEVEFPKGSEGVEVVSVE